MADYRNPYQEFREKDPYYSYQPQTYETKTEPEKVYGPYWEGPGVKKRWGEADDVSRYTPFGEEPEARTPTMESRAVRTTGGTRYKPATGAVTTTRVVRPEGPVPTMGQVPEFEIPEWDRRAIGRMAQAKAAPQVRRLRRSVQRAMARPYENPNVRAMTLREALSGYGQGLQSAMVGAEAAAQAEYGRRYQTQYQARMAEYQANLQKLQSEFQAELQDYLKQYTTTTTTRQTYGTGSTELGIA